jgi:hypothetical protein
MEQLEDRALGRPLTTTLEIEDDSRQQELKNLTLDELLEMRAELEARQI